jgi:hypothetical protein
MLQIRRKPPTSKNQSERLKISLLGAHSLDEKACMILQVIAHLQSIGFSHADPTDFYLPPVDPNHHPLTHFPDGTLIADHYITIAAPYACAADEYDRRFSLHPPAPR